MKQQWSEAAAVVKGSSYRCEGHELLQTLQQQQQSTGRQSFGLYSDSTFICVCLYRLCCCGLHYYFHLFASSSAHAAITLPLPVAVCPLFPATPQVRHSASAAAPATPLVLP